MSLIIAPLFPPRKGCIESRDADGNAIYIPTEETLEKQNLKKENILLKAQLQLQAEHAQMLEGCIVELAAMVYPDA